MTALLGDMTDEELLSLANEQGITNEEVQAAPVEKPTVFRRLSDKLGETAFNVTQAAPEFVKGLDQSAFNTLLGAGELAMKGVNAVAPFAPEGKNLDGALTQFQQKPQNTGQSVGQFVGEGLQFLAPTGPLGKIDKTIDLAKGVPKIGKFLLKSLAQGGATGAVTATQKGGVDSSVIDSAFFSAGFPAVSSVAKHFSGGIAKRAIGALKVDKKNGYKLQNVFKHKLLTAKGGLSGVYKKAQDKIVSKAKQINAMFDKSAKTLDADDVISRLGKEMERLIKEGDAAFDSNSVRSLINKDILNGLLNVTDDAGKLTLRQANKLKQVSANRGVMAFNSKNVELTGEELVYNALNRTLRDMIDDSLEGQAKVVWKEMSELIPIRDAMLRRLPVEERRRLIGLTDAVLGLGTINEPGAAALLGAVKLQASPRVAGGLETLGRSIDSPSGIEEALINAGVRKGTSIAAEEANK